MKTKKRLQRFLSIFLACIMLLNVPMSVFASEGVQLLDVVEEAEVIAVEEEAVSVEEELVSVEEEIFYEETEMPTEEAGVLEETGTEGLDGEELLDDAALVIVEEEQILDNSDVDVSGDIVAVTGISLEESTLELTLGGEMTTLAATVMPEDATDKTVTWTSSAPEVVTVDSMGTLAALTEGEAVITAAAGAYTAACTVTVKAAEKKTSFNVSEESVAITEAGEYTVTGSTTSNNITVADGVKATLILKNVTISLSDGSGDANATDTSAFGTAAIALGEGADVTLKLVGENSLQSGLCRAGIEVPGKYVHKNGTKTETTPANLTIGGNGSLTVEVDDYAAAIGASLLMDAGNITINSGNITAKNNGGEGAGIGGSHAGDKVGTAYGAWSVITINGGVVTAIGGKTGAGIGNGCHGNPGGAVVNITGGIVTASGGSYQNHPDDIGMGYRSGTYTAPVVNISGNAVVVADKINKKGYGAVNYTGGIIVNGSTATMVGSVTLTESYTIPSGTTLTIPADGELIIPAGVVLTVEGTIAGDGSVVLKGGSVYGEDNITSTLIKGDYYTELSVSPDTQTYNQDIVLTLNVKKTADSEVASDVDGTVTFLYGEAELGKAELINGVASYTTKAAWAAGTHQIKAVWTYNETDITDKISVTVTKADQETAPQAPAKAVMVASTSVELEAVTGEGHGAVEYGYAEKTEEGEATVGNWQAETTVNNLIPGKTYLFYSRFAGNEYYNPIVSEKGLEVTTTALPAMSAPALSAEPVSNNLFAITLTAPEACKELEEAAVQYSMSSDNGETWGSWQENSKFSGLTENQEYQFRARYAMTAYEHYSEASNIIKVTAVGIVIPENQYDIATGDTDSQGSQRVRATNIKIAGVDVVKHQKTGDFSATVMLPSDTDKTKEIMFVLDCVANPNMTAAKLFVNNTQSGELVVDATDTTKGQFVYTCVPNWDENGEASISFKTQWNTISWVTKTYTLNFRILGENNTAPYFKAGAAKEAEVLVAVGESYTLKLNESALWEDKELDDLTYTVSVNGAEPVEASGTFYQYGPEKPGEITLVFSAKDSEGNVSEDTYTVKITAMNLMAVDIGGAAVDVWNTDIKKIELGLVDVDSVWKSEDESNTWYLMLDSETQKETELFIRVNASARAGRFMGVSIDGAKVDGITSDGTNFIWTAMCTPEWNDKGEVTLKVNGLPQNDNKYIYYLKLKISNEDNKTPVFSGESSMSAEVEQYSEYTVDVASLFNDVDDSWLSYFVSVNGGEYVKCDAEYSYIPRTTGAHTLAFKAKDIQGAVSEPFAYTLNVDAYEVPEGSYGIGNYKNDGALLSMTILDANGEKIEGVSFETGDSVEGTKEITVSLPGIMKTNDTVKASFHIVQNENAEPFLATGNLASGYKYNMAVNSKTDLVDTTLSQAKGSATVYWYGAAPTSEEDNVYDTYVINYQIVREDNKAPGLVENVEASKDVTIDQYETYSLDLSTIFTDKEGDELTYTVKVNDGEAVSTGKDYKYEAITDEDLVLVFQAIDPFGGVSETYTVNLTVNLVHRHVIETGDPNNGAFGGSISYIHIEGQEVVKSSYNKIDDNHRIIAVELKDTVADNAEIEIGWVDNAQNDRIDLNPSNPIKLVDGKATATIETYGNFFFKTHYYYTILLSNKANTLPALAEGVSETEEKEIVIGSPYEVNLSTIFADADGDALTYTVKVDGGEETAADVEYSYISGKAGMHELVFHAKDNWGSSEQAYTVKLTTKNSDITYDVTVKVPDTVTPEFYANAEFDTDGKDLLGDPVAAEKGQSENGWTSYTVKVPENVTRISFRGIENAETVENDTTTEETLLGEEETPIAWGGMSVAVEKGMAPITLRQVQAVINTKIDDAEGNKIGLTEEQAVFKVKYAENAYAVSGGTGSDEYGYLYYRFLMVAADNSLIYTYFAEPLGDLTGSFLTNQGDVKTVTADKAETLVTVLPLALKKPCKITVPEDAEVRMFNQNGYYNGVEVIPHETIDNGDGTKTVIYNDRGMFRISKEGEITKAGYDPGEELVVDWNDDDRGPNYRRDYATVTDNWMASRGDDSMYVNVNYRNNLQLSVDEEFQLRAYRIWEIINTDTNNIMIEPDFHYNIISGKDVISVTPYDGCSGNAKNNWLDIKGLKAGTAVLEVGYDAIDIISGADVSFGNPAFTYNASDPARTALVVVQVGSAKNDVDFAIDANRTEGWDVEFDTLYFTGNSAELQFSPKSISGANTIAKVAVSNDKGASWSTLTGDQNGVYTAKIVSGNNILRVTTSDGTEAYQVVRGDKISVIVSEVSGASDQDGIMEAGETIHLQFNGVHNVIGKMSGIYNPTDYKTNYTYNGEVVSGNGGQYTYPAAAYVEVTLPGNAKDGDTYTLTNGNTTNGGWGSAGGAHRAVKGEVPPNLDAGGITNSGRNIFPELVLTVGNEVSVTDKVNVVSVVLDKTEAEVNIGKSITLTAAVTPDNATDKTVSWTSSDASVATVEDGVVTGVAEGTAVITAAAGEKTASCTVTVTAASEEEEKPSLDFDIPEEEILGYVTVSFVDNAVRQDSELSGIEAAYKNAVGTIVEPTKVPFKAYDTIAAVTLRLLKAMDMTESHTGTETSGFYLSSIGNFSAAGKTFKSFGEFDAGAGSGWMITYNNWFINQGASEFYVEDGDLIKWQYTCQQGADIGCDKDSPSAEITGVTFKERYGILSPVFDPKTAEYTYTVTEDVNVVALEVLQENYWATVTYTADGKTYKPMADIPVSDGTKMVIDCTYRASAGEAAADTDSITITIKKDAAAADSLKKVDAAETAITALPAAASLTLEDKEKVEAARAAYESLSAEQKALIPAETVKQLKAAQAQIAALEEAAKHTHSWGKGKVTKEATCLTAGVKTYTCACGEKKTETIAKLKPFLKVNATTIPMKVKQSTKAFVVSMEKGDSVVSWKSSNTAVFTVKGNADGTCTIKAGKKAKKSATLTITLKSGLKKTVTVKTQKGTVKSTKISGLTKTMTIQKGSKVKLAPVITPITTQQKISYKSSNKKIVAVASKGVLTAKKAGTAKITVKSGSKKYTVKVTVPGITISKTSVTVKKNKTLTLKPKKYGISGAVTYTSSNTDVATVTSKGKIKGVKKGKATITIKAGSYTQKVTVKVK